jgi:hypothetical protein
LAGVKNLIPFPSQSIRMKGTKGLKVIGLDEAIEVDPYDEEDE